MEKERSTSFFAYHFPALEAGSYTIEQFLEPESDYAQSTKYTSGTQHFYVAGERFVMPPHLVFASYPPKASEGLFTGSLPHIELSRSTIPWERAAEASQSLVKTPWVALLVIREDEIESGQVKPVMMQAATCKAALGLKDEPGEKGETDLQELPVLNFQRSFLQSILPAVEELRLLAHVRVVGNKDEISMAHIPEERAVVVSSRILTSGKYMAHLVSLENRLNNGEFDFREMNGLVPLISLCSWEFNCTPENHYKLNAFSLSGLEDAVAKGKTSISAGKIAQYKSKMTPDQPLFRNEKPFWAHLETELRVTVPDTEKKALLPLFQYHSATLRSLLNNLDVAPFQLQSKTITHAAAQKYLETGSVPLTHHLRAGGNTVSWYRGPFTAFDTVLPEHKALSAFRHADELMQHNLDTGLLDVSYAAAWELGRLLLINEPKLIQQLQLWKLKYNQKLLLVKQKQDVPHLSAFMEVPDENELPASIRQFILQYLKLNEFPYHYLVPHNAMLPPESLRFFRLDKTWMHAFICGVLSIGEAISETKVDRIVRSILLEENKRFMETAPGAQALELENVCGVLIRSEAVSGWPALQIEATSAEKNVPLWHKRYMSDGTMLCLFAGRFDSLALFLPQGDSHFGFSQSGNGFVKEIGLNGLKKYEVQANARFCADIQKLANDLWQLSSGDLAVDLLQRQEKVIFNFAKI